jgi:hypothetical protein
MFLAIPVYKIKLTHTENGAIPYTFINPGSRNVFQLRIKNLDRNQKPETLNLSH